MNARDRRRIFLAVIVTMVAVPAYWWTSRESDSVTATPSPATEAAATVDADAAANGVDSTTATSATTEPPPTTIGRTNLPPADAVDSEPIFLDGPEARVGNVPQIAIPSESGIETLVTEATFRRSISGTDVCLSTTIAVGSVITVTNLNNNRSTTCRVTLAPATQREALVLDVEQFSEIADLTDAPIPVEVRR